MAIVDGDVIQMVVAWPGYGGDLYQNKFTWQWAGTSYPEASLIAALASWAEDFYEILDTEMMSFVTAFTLYVDKIEWNATESAWEVSENIGVTTGSVTLLNASDGLPPQNAPCLVGLTARPKSRGRKWVPFFGEDTQDQGGWETATQTALLLALAEYIATYTVETGKDLVPGVASTVTGTFLPFVASLLTNVVFSQIRRTRGRGA